LKYEQYLSENKEDIDTTIFAGSITFYKCTFLIETIEKENKPEKVRKNALKHARDTLKNVEGELLNGALESCALRDPSRRAVIDSLLTYTKTNELPEEHRDERVNNCLKKLKEYASNEYRTSEWKRKLNTAYANKAFELVNNMLGSSNDVNDMKLVATFRMIKKKTFEKDPNSSERDRTAIEGKRVADRVEKAADTTCKSVYLAEAEDSKEMKDIMAAMLDGLSDKEEDAEDKYDEIAEKVKSSLCLKNEDD